MFKDSSDGFKHLAMSVIERAQADLEYGDLKTRREARAFLRHDAWLWAVLAGGNPEVVRPALARKYAKL